MCTRYDQSCLQASLFRPETQSLQDLKMLFLHRQVQTFDGWCLDLVRLRLCFSEGKARIHLAGAVAAWAPLC